MGYLCPWHLATSYPILPEGEWDFEIVGFCLAYYYYYYYPILPEGEWDFEIVGFCLPYYPILPEGEWDFEIVGFCLPYIIIIRVVVVVQLGLYIEDIWMKLGRYMGHGPNSSYRDG